MMGYRPTGLVLWVLTVLGLIVLWSSHLAVASSWPTDPTQNLPIVSIPIDHLAPKIATDGAGGAIITWEDYRFGTTLDANVYAQRVNVNGVLMWTVDGEHVSDAPGHQVDPQIVYDGVSAAIIVWTDSRNGIDYDIFAQRFGGNVATAFWDSNGVAICLADSNQVEPRIISDGVGGAIITWRDFRGTDPDIYAQRIDADGNALWPTDGVPICTDTADQLLPELTTDGENGAIIIWRDLRNLGAESIYARRVDSNGQALWTADGVPIRTVASHNRMHQIAPDDSGGAIIVWSWKTSNNDIYAQRVNPSGTTLWATNGIIISAAVDKQAWPQIIPDGQSGAIICWSDGRTDVADIYANRVDNLGNILWVTDGVPVSEAANVQSNPQIAPDGAGGAFLAWQDSRNVQFEPDIYAQHIDANGDSLWASNGVAVSTAADWQWIPQLVPSASGSAIITWGDQRRPEFFDNDVYVQQVGPGGTLGEVPTGIPPTAVPRLSATHNYPNPFAAATIIEYELQIPSPVAVTIYNASGKRVARIRRSVQRSGRQTITWNGVGDHGGKVASGIYFYRVQAGRFTQTSKMVIVR